jgi:nitrite reductase (NADH) large subunit
VNILSSGIVIIGGGIAGISAIKAIREVDGDVEISMFSNEIFYPYNRLRLTKGLFGNLEEDNILLQKKQWYEANKVKLNINKGVTGINIEDQEVLLSDGSKIKYNKLLLACGSSNFKPPIEGIDKENVYTIRYLEQAWEVKRAAEDRKTPLIIGGGIQGLETAWELNQQGNLVHIAEIQARLMPKQLDERASKILQEIIEDHRAKIHLNTKVEKIAGENSGEAIVTKEGIAIPCDMIIYNAGTRTNIGVIKNSLIDINKGVIVNSKMQTNIENIYAAGDVAEFKDRISGLWNIAIEQGKTAGYNMVGKDEEYKDIVPVTTLNAFGVSLFSMGSIDESECNMTLIEDGADNKTYKRIFIKDNKVIGAIVIGDTKKSPILKSAIEGQVSLDKFNLSSISVEDLLDGLKK